jgi:hypothetical protein
MKQSLTRGLIVAAFLTTIGSYGIDKTGNYILYIKTGNGKTAAFTLNADQKATFSIYDQNNKLLYSGESGNSELEVSKTLSLEAYPAGTYFLEVQENNKVVKHQIVVSSKKIKTVKIDQTVNESPAFRR